MVEDADALVHADCARTAERRRELGGPPILALLTRADAARRADLAGALGLIEPVHAGGGWDVPSCLQVRALNPPAARRARIEAVGADPPALVLARDRARADQVAAVLALAALRVAAAVPGMRAGRLTEAAQRWRGRRLDALVVTPDTDLTLLGRVRPALLLGTDPPPQLDQWRDLVAALGVPRACLLVEPGAPTWAREWAATPGCLRAWLLERFGEPAPSSCARCARCVAEPTGGRPTALTTARGQPATGA